MRRRAFTLIELIFVVIILAILVTVALPGFVRTTERAQQRQAWDALRTIYASEQVFFSVNNEYSDTWNDGDPDQPDLGDYMDDPNVPGVTYTIVAAAGPPATFTATATRAGAGECGGMTMTTNQVRTMGGPWLTCPMGGL